MLEKNGFLFFGCRFLLHPKVITGVKNNLYVLEGGLGNTNQNHNEKYTSKKKL